MVPSSRRRFLQGSLALAGSGLLAGCGLPPPPWQQPAKVPRIGVVSGGSAEFAAPHFEALRQGLREHGYDEGRSVLIEWRTLEGRTERAPEVMEELLRLGVAAIVTGNPPSVLAARRATSTVPIIMAGTFGDPIEQTGGVVASFNRPGGNVTGLSLLVPTLVPKRLQLLKEAAPQAVRLAAVWDRTLGPFVEARSKLLEDTGPSVGFEVRSVFVQRVEELEPTFEAIRQGGADALHVTEGPVTASNARTPDNC